MSATANSIRPFVLAETNWQTVQKTDYQVAILPWGATEAHNYHLPYATDNLQAEAVANESASRAWERGAHTIVLPCIPFGVNTGQLDIALCMNLNPSTQLAILTDLADVIVRAGIDKLVILNGHGGNHFKQMIRELAIRQPELFACSVNWYLAGGPLEYFDDPGDHAGDLETSMMLHLNPQWVRPLSEAGDGAARQFRFAAFKEGWATAQRQWSQVTSDTGVGDPSKATAAKGKAYFDACANKIADFLVELAQTPRNDLYEPATGHEPGNR